MSVVGEIIAVTAMVAALVSAYKDGSIIVRRLKEKRQARKALASSVQLEQSLARGPIAVEDAKNAGIQKFGQAFAHGDGMTFSLHIGGFRDTDLLLPEHARNSLRDIIIELQGGIIRELGKALEDDSQVDFSVVMEVSDTGRMRAVVVLNELYLRLAGPAKPLVSPAHFASAMRRDDAVPIDPGHVVAYQTKSSDIQLPLQLQNITLGEDGLSPTRRGSTNPNIRVGFGQRFQRVFADPATRRRSAARATTDATSPVVMIGADPPTRHTSISTQSTFGPDTKFDGFCKGAYYLQVGLVKEAVKLRNASQSFQGEGYYFTCASSKCCFETPATKQGHEWVLDSTVEEAFGLRFRRSFLLKSHITTSKAKGKSFLYQCYFCIQQSRPSPVLKGIGELLRHVSSHQGEQLPSTNKLLVGGDNFDIEFPQVEMLAEDYRSCRSRLSSEEDLSNYAVADREQLVGRSGSVISDHSAW